MALPNKTPGGPLSGVRIVDLTVNVLGPVATQILGDMGADVIKVETPTGDPNRDTGPRRHEHMSAMHLNMNRNKRSVTLDLKSVSGREALMRLVETADVFVHSMRPAAAKRLGVGYDVISARNSRIIYGYGPGYRQDGPNRDYPAYDDVIQGESGIASLVAQVTGGGPRFYPTVIIDKLCGYVLASAIGMALYERERSGLGQEIHVPMFETILAFNYLEHLWGGAFDPPLPPGIGYVRLLTKHRKPYPTLDGHICVLAVNDDQWRRIFPALDRPDLVNDPRFAKTNERVSNYDELYAIVGEQLQKKTTAEWHRILDEADIPNGPVHSLQELVDDAYLNQTGFFQRYDHPSEGPVVTPMVPVQFSRTPGGLHQPPPQLGEHTEEVFRELGYSDQDIAALVARA